MAEVRKHNPDEADGLAKLVRDALGGDVRPHEPGRTRHAAGDQGDQEPEARDDDDTVRSAATLPSWAGDGQIFTF